MLLGKTSPSRRSPRRRRQTDGLLSAPTGLIVGMVATLGEPGGSPPPGRRLLKRLIGSEHLAGWMFVAPAVILIAIFFLIPIGWSLILSLQANNLLGPRHYVGLRQLQRALQGPRRSARRSGHTVVYTGDLRPDLGDRRARPGGGAQPQDPRDPLLPAGRVHAAGHLDGGHRDPVPVAAGPDVRPGQLLLQLVGLPQQQFLQSPSEALYCIVAMTVWGWLGFDVIVYLAALQGIPEELIEAAEMDGASRFSRFADRAAAARPGDAVPRRLVDDQRAAAVRRDLRDHPRRAAGVDDGDRLLPLPAGVPVLQRRLRVGDRLRPVRRRS